MPRKQKQFHFIYKTTNLINNKFYVGMHSTNSLADGYVGSGKLLGYSIRKYGLENHKVEILEFLSSREELKKREAEIVNEELLSNPRCMNLKFGGEGGGRIWNEAHELAFRKANAIATRKRIAEQGQPPGILEKLMPWNNNTRCNWLGRKHSEETKQKLRKPKNIGEMNSQFGTCWICNDIEVKKIKKEELQSWLEQGWRKGRK